MTPYWIGLASGLALVALALAWIAFQGGKLWGERSVRFTCPHLGSVVDCRIVQDVRTGQWKELVACSAFADPDRNTCDRECVRLANLGRLTLGLRRAA
ncbi:MAG TPA: hypothetical protein VFM88_13470 [Vicinamibacteria bacterium]|nr:hypothetical protein [Vicinamibacteria bacterium]